MPSVFNYAEGVPTEKLLNTITKLNLENLLWGYFITTEPSLRESSISICFKC